MKKVYETLTVIDAELVRARLRADGVRSDIEGAEPGLRGPATPVSVWVKPADAARAAALISAWKGKKKPKTPAPRRARAATSPAKIRRVLVALDGTREAESVLRWLPRFAPGARLTLVKASPPLYLPGPEGMVAALPALADDGLAYLNKLAARLRPRPEVAAVPGPPGAALLDEARRRKVDAVALATRGGAAALRRVAGGMTEKLIHGCDLPVLAVPAGRSVKAGKIRTVAVPVNGTPESEAVLRFLVPWALRAKAQVVIVHALSGLDDLETVAARASLKRVREVARTAEGYLRRAEARFEGLAARLRARGLRARAEFTRGPLPETLIATAGAVGAGMIALSMRPHGTLRHLVSGGLASRIIQASPVPVLVIRAGRS